MAKTRCIPSFLGYLKIFLSVHAILRWMKILIGHHLQFLLSHRCVFLLNYLILLDNTLGIVSTTKLNKVLLRCSKGETSFNFEMSSPKVGVAYIALKIEFFQSSPSGPETSYIPEMAKTPSGLSWAKDAKKIPERILLDN